MTSRLSSPFRPLALLAVTLLLMLGVGLVAAPADEAGAADEDQFLFLPLLHKPFSPLYLDLYARWDGEGFLQFDKNATVGSHASRLVDQIDGDNVQVFSESWYDPDPFGWGSDSWYAYYSFSTGEFLSSSQAPDPAWKWRLSWLLPYDLTLHNGQTIDLGGQTFAVTGPYSGHTVFGQPVQYWRLVNEKRFLMWDDGGQWQQFVLAGDATLLYDAGVTRLLLKSDLKRTYYLNGSKSPYYVHYIDDLTESSSFPQGGASATRSSPAAPEDSLPHFPATQPAPLN